MTHTAVFDFELIEDPDSGALMLTLPVLDHQTDGAVYGRFDGYQLVLTFADGHQLPLGPFDDDAIRDLARQESILVAEIGQDGDIATAYHVALPVDGYPNE
ncbi:MAG: hypothetical protein GC134_09500 [Proteobacteria bacterium]|nr:hypothetical protein [Pseudomonadota bacterium]